MNKTIQDQRVHVSVNIPSSFLIQESDTQFVDVQAVVVNANNPKAIIERMTFSGCIAFSIKQECYVQLIEIIESACIKAATLLDQEFLDDQFFYHEIAQHGV